MEWEMFVLIKVIVSLHACLVNSFIIFVLLYNFSGIAVP